MAITYLAVHQSIENLNIGKPVVTIGSFDGVHSGHKMLLRRVVDLARRNVCRSAVITFWPHPRMVLAGEKNAPLLLNTLDEKIALLQQTGVDDVVILPFDNALSQMSASDFIRNIVVGKLNAHYLVTGRDHRFGKGGRGDVHLLPSLISDCNIRTEVIDLKMLDKKIGSSAIRNALIHGDLQSANEMSGYEYIISGKVVVGDRLGRTIGFPTVNIETPEYKLIPKEGVYRVKVNTDAENSGTFTRLGMMYIGKRPVLKQQNAPRRVEVNIFDFDEQIYGREIAFALTHRIRDDINFDSLDRLAAQLKSDKENILKIDHK